jgi:hypothetical protein
MELIMRNFSARTRLVNTINVGSNASDDDLFNPNRCESELTVIAEKLVRAFQQNPGRFVRSDEVFAATTFMLGVVRIGDDYCLPHDAWFTPSEFGILRDAALFVRDVKRHGDMAEKTWFYVNLNEGHTVTLINHLG